MRSSLSLAASPASWARSPGAQAQDTSMSFLRDQRQSRQGRRPRRPRGRRRLLQAASPRRPALSAGKTWQAYLSTDTENAKDRIGAGPWYNAKGDKIADDVASLHGDANNITKQTALDETGEVDQRPRRHAQPPRHPDRLASRTAPPRRETCGNWTMGGAEGAAMMGHHDRTGLDDSAAGEVVELLACLARRLQPRGASRAPAATACSTASLRTDAEPAVRRALAAALRGHASPPPCRLPLERHPLFQRRALGAQVVLGLATYPRSRAPCRRPRSPRRGCRAPAGSGGDRARTPPAGRCAGPCPAPPP